MAMYVRANAFMISAATFLIVSGHSNAPETDNLNYEISSIVDEELSNCEFTEPGLGVAVIAKNSVGNVYRNFTYSKGFGRDIENEIPATDDTLFCIGSITKHFTATLLVDLLDLLQQKGQRYNLQTLATELDGTLNFPGSNFVGVTLEDILSHRTGITDVFNQLNVGYPRNTTRKYLAWIAANLPRTAKNRERYEYNNHVFASAGYFAEILAEKLLKRVISWEQLMHFYLLDPLGMRDDADLGEYSFKSAERVSLPYIKQKGHYRLLDPRTFDLIEPAGPAGSLCLTPKAMAVWMQF